MSDERLVFGTLIISLTLIFVFGTLFVFNLYYLKRKLHYIRERQVLEIKQQQLQAEIEIQERTFQTISQEIHDNVGQLLSLAKLNLNTADIYNPPAINEKIENSKELISKSILALRNLSKSLNAELITEIGLAQSIERELSLLSKSGLYKTCFAEHGTCFRLEHQKEIVLFRIFQETLNNIIKHSNAQSVNVNIVYNQNNFSLRIVDDGVGFLIHHTKCNQQGLGLLNMQNRARLIGADLQFTSGVGQGTAISIVLPTTPSIKT